MKYKVIKPFIRKSFQRKHGIPTPTPAGAVFDLDGRDGDVKDLLGEGFLVELKEEPKVEKPKIKTKEENDEKR
jgi:hypothetical protein